MGIWSKCRDQHGIFDFFFPLTINRNLKFSSMGELDNIIEWLARDILGQKAIMIEEHILLFRFLLNIINFIYIYIYRYNFFNLFFLFLRCKIIN